jgi:two-component system, response regulator RegA
MTALTQIETTHQEGRPRPTLARVEWEYIQLVLAGVGGNVSETARRLGIARRTLQLKLKKNPPAF